MRSLFEIDTKDYDINGTTVSRPSARGIIIKDGKLAMIHSIKYDYYKFPGGGIEKNEQRESALIREVLEETGLDVIPQTIKEYGMVHRIQKGDYEDVFIQDNYYYLCDVEDNVHEQKLDDYEKEEKKVWLTDEGIKYAESFFKIDNFYGREYFEINRHVILALRAHALFAKEKEYMISKDGELQLLDGGSGRMMPGVKLRGGQHQALEMKEKLKISQENRSMASI